MRRARDEDADSALCLHLMHGYLLDLSHSALIESLLRRPIPSDEAVCENTSDCSSVHTSCTLRTWASVFSVGGSTLADGNAAVADAVGAGRSLDGITMREYDFFLKNATDKIRHL